MAEAPIGPHAHFCSQFLALDAAAPQPIIPTARDLSRTTMMRVSPLAQRNTLLEQSPKFQGMMWRWNHGRRAATVIDK